MLIEVRFDLWLVLVLARVSNRYIMMDKIIESSDKFVLYCEGPIKSMGFIGDFIPFNQRLDKKDQNEEAQNEKAQSEGAQNEKAQSEGAQNEKAQSEEVQNEKAQSEEAQNEEVQTEEAQTDDAQTDEAQTDKAQTEDFFNSGDANRKSYSTEPRNENGE